MLTQSTKNIQQLVRIHRQQPDKYLTEGERANNASKDGIDKKEGPTTSCDNAKMSRRTDMYIVSGSPQVGYGAASEDADVLQLAKVLYDNSSKMPRVVKDMFANSLKDWVA